MRATPFRFLRGGWTSRHAGLVADTQIRNQVGLSHLYGSPRPLLFGRTEPEAPRSWTESGYGGERRKGAEHVETSFPSYSQKELIIEERRVKYSLDRKFKVKTAVRDLFAPTVLYNFFLLIRVINTDRLNKWIHQAIEYYEISYWDKLNKVEPIICTRR